MQEGGQASGGLCWGLGHWNSSEAVGASDPGFLKVENPAHRGLVLLELKGQRSGAGEGGGVEWDRPHPSQHSSWKDPRWWSQAWAPPVRVPVAAHLPFQQHWLGDMQGLGGSPAPPLPVSPPSHLALLVPLVWGGHTRALISVTLMLVRSNISIPWTHLAGSRFPWQRRLTPRSLFGPLSSPPRTLPLCSSLRVHSPSTFHSGLVLLYAYPSPPDHAVQGPGLCLAGPLNLVLSTLCEHGGGGGGCGAVVLRTRGIHLWLQREGEGAEKT